MLTFSLNLDENVNNMFDEYASHAWQLITKNEGYFRKFNGDRCKEAMQAVWLHVIEHRDPRYKDDLLPYIKKLARTKLRVREPDIPVSVYDDEGKVNYIYQELSEENKGVTLLEVEEDYKQVLYRLTVLYLESPKEFEKLRVVTQPLDKVSLSLYKRKGDWYNNFGRLLRDYSVTIVRDCLCEFFRRLDKESSSVKFKEGIKVTSFNKPDVSLTSYVEDDGIIYKGERYHLNPQTLRMNRNIDLDHVFWSPSNGNTVIKVGIEDCMDSIISDILVEKGVNTPLIRWCNDSYIMRSPAGVTSPVDADRDVFIEYCFRELVLNIASHSKSILAVSDRYVYTTPPRKLGYNILELKSKQGCCYKLHIEGK